MKQFRQIFLIICILLAVAAMTASCSRRAAPVVTPSIAVEVAEPEPTPTPGIIAAEDAYEGVDLSLLSLDPPPRLGAYDGDLIIVNCDVNQGDATLIVAPNGRVVLFDTGTIGGASGVLDACELLGIEVIDVIVISHFDADHYGGLEKILTEPLSTTGRPLELRRGLVTKGYEPPDKFSQPTFQRYEAIKSSHPFQVIEPGDYIPIDDSVSLRCLAADMSVVGDTGAGSANTSDDNYNSVVLLLEYNGFEYQMTGDAAETTEAKLTAAFSMDIDAYRAGHHGADTSSGREFLDAWLPETVIISMGAHGGYLHPRRAAVERILDTPSFMYAFQTNKNTRVNDSDPNSRGLNFADEWIADLDPEGYTGHVYMYVGENTYTVGYDNSAEDRSFFIEVPIQH